MDVLTVTKLKCLLLLEEGKGKKNKCQIFIPSVSGYKSKYTY